MAFESTLMAKRLSIQDALDDLSSPRSSAGAKSRALQALERNIAMACIECDNSDEKDAFFALQYTFECNVPLRLLAWIGLATARLDVLTNNGTMDDIQEAEAAIIASQLSLSLSLIQGVVLNHPASKEFLGRKYGQEILLDLLLASRHYPTPPPSASSDAVNDKSTSPPPPPLTSAVLDTLLCVLVDSSTALRAFEGAAGPQAVVKILKRAGTPREVRMKCLEFLYFYLLDETPVPEPNSSPSSSSTTPTPSTPTLPPTAPATPIRPPKPYLSATPHRPTSRYGSSTYSFSSSASSSRSTSDSSMKSFSSTSSNASSSTNASSVSSSPEKGTRGRPSLSPVKQSQSQSTPSTDAKPITTTANPRTPPKSPPPPLPTVQRFPLQPLQPRSMMMLKKEVDYVPLSPKKPQGQVSSGGGGMRYTHTPKSKSVGGLVGSQGMVGSRSGDIVGSRSLSKLASLAEGGLEKGKWDGESRGKNRSGSGAEAAPAPVPVPPRKDRDERRTTEEKKELLGTMLGNVDALVEGVRKAGIWGLG